jgi:hypothetical protein
MKRTPSPIIVYTETVYDSSNNNKIRTKMEVRTRDLKKYYLDNGPTPISWKELSKHCSINALTSHRRYFSMEGEDISQIRPHMRSILRLYRKYLLFTSTDLPQDVKTLITKILQQTIEPPHLRLYI